MLGGSQEDSAQTALVCLAVQLEAKSVREKKATNNLCDCAMLDSFQEESFQTAPAWLAGERNATREGKDGSGNLAAQKQHITLPCAAAECWAVSKRKVHKPH